ncbi:MAG TPA: hypothetical protein VJ819_04485 [Nocardioidaceae bacterium]|jgi:hypothetical protein|nr:hypothetical protein [Nocardioidaceae bacterium]
MHGLTVRWSLEEAPDGVDEALAAYVEATSHAKFSGREGLRFKTWRSRSGEWFEGCYVFESPEARDEFQEQFTASAAESPGSQIIGSAPVLIEPCEIVAVAEGGSGFLAAPSFR